MWKKIKATASHPYFWGAINTGAVSAIGYGVPHPYLAVAWVVAVISGAAASYLSKGVVPTVATKGNPSDVHLSDAGIG